MAKQGFNSLNDFFNASSNLAQHASDEEKNGNSFINTNAQKSQAGANQLQGQMNQQTNNTAKDEADKTSTKNVQSGFDSVRWNTPTSGAAQGSSGSTGFQNNVNWSAPSYGSTAPSAGQVSQDKGALNAAYQQGQGNNAAALANTNQNIDASSQNQTTQLANYLKDQNQSVSDYQNAKNVDQLGTQSATEGAGASLNAYLAGLNGTTNVGALGNYFGGSYNAGKYGALDSQALGGQIDKARGLASSIVQQNKQVNADKVAALQNYLQTGTDATNRLNDFNTAETKTIGDDATAKKTTAQQQADAANAGLTDYFNKENGLIDSNAAAASAAANSAANNKNTTTVTNPNGSVTTKNPDILAPSHNNDGTVTATSGDSSTRMPDGTVVTTSTDPNTGLSNVVSTGTDTSSPFNRVGMQLPNIKTSEGIPAPTGINMVKGASPSNPGALGNWDGSMPGLTSGSDPFGLNGLNANAEKLAAKGLTINDWLKSGIKSLPDYLKSVGA